MTVCGRACAEQSRLTWTLGTCGGGLSEHSRLDALGNEDVSGRSGHEKSGWSKSKAERRLPAMARRHGEIVGWCTPKRCSMNCTRPTGGEGGEGVSSRGLKPAHTSSLASPAHRLARSRHPLPTSLPPPRPPG